MTGESSAAGHRTFGNDLASRGDTSHAHPSPLAQRLPVFDLCWVRPRDSSTLPVAPVWDGRILGREISQSRVATDPEDGGTHCDPWFIGEGKAPEDGYGGPPGSASRSQTQNPSRADSGGRVRPVSPESIPHPFTGHDGEGPPDRVSPGSRVGRGTNSPLRPTYGRPGGAGDTRWGPLTLPFSRGEG